MHNKLINKDNSFVDNYYMQRLMDLLSNQILQEKNTMYLRSKLYPVKMHLII